MSHREICHCDVQVPAELLKDLLEGEITTKLNDCFFENLSVEYDFAREQVDEKLKLTRREAAQQRLTKGDFRVKELPKDEKVLNVDKAS